MTLAQFLEVVKRRHNAEATGDTYWSDEEIYQLITNRCNEALAYIGLLEGTATDTSVSGTQAYDFPSDAVTLRQVNYKADRLKRITFRQWQLFKTETSTTSGRPYMYTIWNRQVLLISIPDTDGDTITFYYYKEHPYIDNSSQTTIDIPSVLHPHLVTGVLADMYMKDLNTNGAQFYENRWQNQAIPAFQRFKVNEDSAGGGQVIADSDTGVKTSQGPV